MEGKRGDSRASSPHVRRRLTEKGFFMNNRTRFSAALLSFLAVMTCYGVYSKCGVEAATQSERSDATNQHQAGDTNATSNSSDPESLYGPSFSYLAWDLFLQAMTPSSHG